MKRKQAYNHKQTQGQHAFTVERKSEKDGTTTFLHVPNRHERWKPTQRQHDEAMLLVQKLLDQRRERELRRAERMGAFWAIGGMCTIVCMSILITSAIRVVL